MLEPCAAAELQRFPAVQAQTRPMGTVLRERGWPGVVLNRAAHRVEGGEPLDVADLAVHLPREHAVEFAAILKARGGTGPWAPMPRGRAGTGWQLAARLAQHEVQVELLSRALGVEPVRDRLPRSRATWSRPARTCRAPAPRRATRRA